VKLCLLDVNVLTAHIEHADRSVRRLWAALESHALFSPLVRVESLRQTQYGSLTQLEIGDEMPRVQVIVVKDDTVLLVKHRRANEEWWCLPGGAQEAGETPGEGALRELREECQVTGSLVRQTSHVRKGPGDQTITFLVDIGSQVPRVGADPDVPQGREVLCDVRWLRLRDVPERVRAFLWAAGLLGIDRFLSEVRSWGGDTSYPDHGSSDESTSSDVW
jgi:ADP-ribose pyrophosphatase YjhB (NUDIX family)